MQSTEQKPPFPPFNADSARQKVRLAEDAWNSRDPEKVALAYTVDSQWRNRSAFPVGREQIKAFLHSKWQKENAYRLVKNCGCLMMTGSPWDLPMSGMMKTGSGFDLMATKIGILLKIV